MALKVGIRISKATGGAYADMAEVIHSELAKIREESAARGDIYETAASKASEIYAQAAEKVGEVARTARGNAARKTSTVAAAIDAGKKAYQEEKRKTELSGRIEAAPQYTEKPN